MQGRHRSVFLTSWLHGRQLRVPPKLEIRWKLGLCHCACLLQIFVNILQLSIGASSIELLTTELQELFALLVTFFSDAAITFWCAAAGASFFMQPHTWMQWIKAPSPRTSACQRCACGNIRLESCTLLTALIPTQWLCGEVHKVLSLAT